MLEKHGRTYRIQLRRDGVTQWISTGATTLRDAKRAAERVTALFDREKQSRALAHKLCEYALALARRELCADMMHEPLRALEAQAALEVMPVIEALFPAPPVTAAELWSRYIDSRPEVKPVTLATRRQRYSTFEEWAKDRDVSTMNVADCRRFLASRDASPQTVKNYVSDLSVVFAAAGVVNPWKTEGLRPKHVENAETPPITVEQARRILTYCDEHADAEVGKVALGRWAAFLRAAYYSGQRPVDVCRFEYREFDGMVIDLLPEKTSRTRRKVNYKADPLLRALLDSLPRTDKKYYFPEFAAMYARGRDLPGRYFVKIAARAGVPEARLYGFRHGFITQQIDAGADAEDLAAAVGHDSTETTRRHYYHGKKTIDLPAMPEV